MYHLCVDERCLDVVQHACEVRCVAKERAAQAASGRDGRRGAVNARRHGLRLELHDVLRDRMAIVRRARHDLSQCRDACAAVVRIHIAEQVVGGSCPRSGEDHIQQGRWLAEHVSKSRASYTDRTALITQ